MEATIKEQAAAIAKLTKRGYKLEQEQFRMHGIFAVKDQSELLLARVSKLEQYTRYSVVARGIPRPQQRETSDLQNLENILLDTNFLGIVEIFLGI